MRKHRSSFSFVVPLLGSFLGACSLLPREAEVPAPPAPSYAEAPADTVPGYAAVPEDSVEVHDIADSVPEAAVSVARFTVPEWMLSNTDEQVIASYRPRAARLGATWITLDRSGGRRRVVAYYVPLTARIRHAVRNAGARPAAASTPSSSGSGSVHVRGYYRRDGTYVRPHTRSRPGRRH